MVTSEEMELRRKHAAQLEEAREVLNERQLASFAAFLESQMTGSVIVTTRFVEVKQE